MDSSKRESSGQGESGWRVMNLRALSNKLDQIEAELKRLGYWDENPPDLQSMAARGEIRSYLDAPSFQSWLQALFLPNARRAVEKDALPSESQVGVIAMRQYDYHSYAPEAEKLVQLLSEFDTLVHRHPKRSPLS